MFKNWGNWLGIENENGQVLKESESNVIVDANEDTNHGINKPTAVAKSEQSSEKDAQPPQLLQKVEGFSGKFCKVYKIA